MRSVGFVATANDIKEKDIAGRAAVVADVLRATSTIITALYNGCKAVMPVKEIEEALSAAARFGEEAILGGERRGRMIAGFHLSNSPREYTPEAVRGKVVILTTTNGTKALVNAAAAKETVVLSFLNYSAVFEYLCRIPYDICLAAAGVYGEFSMEDTVCCGLLADRLQRETGARLTPEAAEAAEIARPYEGKTMQLFSDSSFGHYLQEIGYGADLEFCARMDAFPVTARYEKGLIHLVT